MIECVRKFKNLKISFEITPLFFLVLGCGEGDAQHEDIIYHFNAVEVFQSCF